MAEPGGARRKLEADASLELVACPFCASTNLGVYEHVFAQQFAISCNLCGAEGPRRSSQDEAIRLWNRRVQV